MGTGCTTAKADDERKTDIFVDNSVTVSEGYYLSDNDESYIHIENGQIELCDYDYVADFTESWNNIEDSKVSLDEYIENSAELFLAQIELQSFTPVRFEGCTEDGGDIVILVLNYDSAAASGAYSGYILNDDGTISKVDNIYTYYGAELPES
jgi:hypothetical protein